jgi:hypothetical protein
MSAHLGRCNECGTPDLPDGTVLVRCSVEMVERLVNDGSEPVVIVGLVEGADGTYDLALKTPAAT